MPKAATSVVVRAANPNDVEILDRVLPGLPHAPTSKHQQRLELQRIGRAVYLVAWLGARPIGHALVHVVPRSRHAQALGCAEVEDLAVEPLYQRRGAGKLLLDAAEAVACSAGRAALGLAVAADNPDSEAARALYLRRGYRDGGRGVFAFGYTYWDEAGSPHRHEEPHVFLVKALA